MMEYGIAILISYIVTVVIAQSSIMEPVRRRVIALTPRLRIGTRPHPIECRLCLGFWVSLAVGVICGVNPLAVYGASYFLATQER